MTVMGGWTRDETVAVNFRGVEEAFCRCRELRLSDVEHVERDRLAQPEIVVTIPNAMS
jgi:hypothetical protein